MSILNVNKINPIGGGSTVTIAGIASVTNSVTAPTFVGDINNSTLLLQTGSSERLSITSVGDVGINVTPTNNDMAGVKPRLHVSGISTDGQFNTVARFQAGGDADSTGAMIVINHGNDRGLAIQGGRRTGNYAHGALKMIDNVGRLSNAIFIHGGAGQGVNYMGFYTGESTTTTERLRITSDGALQQTGTSGLSYFKGSSEYIFGSNSSSPPAGGYESVLQVQGAKTRSAFTVAAYMDNAGGPFMTFLSSRSGTVGTLGTCLLYTSPSPRDRQKSRMPSSA